MGTAVKESAPTTMLMPQQTIELNQKDKIKLWLSNPLPNKLLWRIHCSDHKILHIRPHEGIVQTGDRVQIELHYKPDKAIKDKELQLMITLLECPITDTANDNPHQLWSKLRGHETGATSYYVQRTNTQLRTAESPTDYSHTNTNSDSIESKRAIPPAHMVVMNADCEKHQPALHNQANINKVPHHNQHNQRTGMQKFAHFLHKLMAPNDDVVFGGWRSKGTAHSHSHQSPNVESLQLSTAKGTESTTLNTARSLRDAHAHHHSHKFSPVIPTLRSGNLPKVGHHVHQPQSS